MAKYIGLGPICTIFNKLQNKLLVCAIGSTK